MTVTVKQAIDLLPGDKLAFNTNHLYEVLKVEPRGVGVYLTLLRDDGLETFATETDLDVASLGPVLDETIATPDLPSEDEATDYAVWTVPQLLAEIKRRGFGLLEGGGSGTKGAYIKTDYVSILEHADTHRQV